MGQEFSKTATQGQFAALGVFLLGISLLIYGLRLTLKATDKQTDRYFKACHDLGTNYSRYYTYCGLPGRNTIGKPHTNL